VNVKRLLLMRHAKSSWGQAGLTDFERPLKPRGEEASLLMGRMLQLNDLTPAHILSSTAERAQATARLILTQFSPEPSLQLTDELYHASPRTLVSCLRETGDRYDSLLLIAHNPGLEELIYQWTSEYVAFPTAAIALFEWPVERWSQVELNTSIACDQLWKPKELDPEHLDPSSPQE
jgi:phosphohistidine phosphatase